MPEESKRISLFIFLFAIFIVLAVIIFVFMYNAYKGATNYSSTTTKTSVECAGYSFRIVGGTILYENGILSFEFDPSLGGAREKNPLIIVIGKEEIETKPVDFTFKQRIKIETAPLEEFQIYPKGCKDIIRNCSLAKNRCE